MSLVKRSDDEINNLKEQIIKNLHSQQDDPNLKAYLEGQMVIMIWLTTDLWLSQCYEQINNLLTQEKNCAR